MRCGNDGAGLDGAMQVAGHKNVDWRILHLLCHLTGLRLACVVQLSSLMALKYLGLVGHGLTVTH